MLYPSIPPTSKPHETVPLNIAAIINIHFQQKLRVIEPTGGRTMVRPEFDRTVILPAESQEWAVTSHLVVQCA
jgi:hypothetical protein